MRLGLKVLLFEISVGENEVKTDPKIILEPTIVKLFEKCKVLFIIKSDAGDDDYMCWVCLKNHSCGYCGASYGGCIEPGTSCINGVFKKTDQNCCPHMCRGRGDCIAQNDKKTAFKCDCIIFYQGVSCDNLSVFTYLLITAAVFLLLIALITIRYYYFSRQQKAKVLQELRAGLLTGSADDHGAENRSYIQAIQQDLILRDVFVNYEDISFEGRIFQLILDGGAVSDILFSSDSETFAGDSLLRLLLLPSNNTCCSGENT